MLFMYIHTRTPERCIADQAKELLQLLSNVREGCQLNGVKIVSACAAPQEHAMYWLIESDNASAMSATLRPITVWGTAHLIPVQDMEYMKA